MKSSYPKECPVFRVVKANSALCPVGGVVVGTYVDDGDRFGYPIIGAVFPGSDRAWMDHHWWYMTGELLPLTLAARAMLAIARGAK